MVFFSLSEKKYMISLLSQESAYVCFGMLFWRPFSFLYTFYLTYLNNNNNKKNEGLTNIRREVENKTSSKLHLPP